MVTAASALRWRLILLAFYLSPLAPHNSRLALRRFPHFFAQHHENLCD